MDGGRRRAPHRGQNPASPATRQRGLGELDVGELWNTRSTATSLQGDWALAMTTYNRVAAELGDVTGQGETIRIVLDDVLSHDTSD
ncbi:hypothetical protein ACFYOR_31320 [Streptomyces griseofuscus]|uniref:hypothetical protein n=1 Tax=Streptomyces griseofuscus TaxID=146922 RepID=UPI0036858853